MCINQLIALPPHCLIKSEDIIDMDSPGLISLQKGLSGIPADLDKISGNTIQSYNFCFLNQLVKYPLIYDAISR